MLIVLAIAYGCVMLDQYLKTLNARLFDITLIRITMWLEVFFNLLIAGLVILLFWLMVTRTSRSRAVGVIFLLVGIFLATYFSLAWTLAQYIQLYMPAYLDTELVPNSIFSYAAAGIAMIGLYILVLPGSRVSDK